MAMSRATWKPYQMGVLVLALQAVAGMLWAANESNNGVTSIATSATVTFAMQKGEVHFTNDCANAVWVKVWVSGGGEEPGAITTSTSGARMLRPGEGWGQAFDPGRQAGVGYAGFSHITAAGATCETATSALRWFAQ